MPVCVCVHVCVCECVFVCVCVSCLDLFGSFWELRKYITKIEMQGSL